MGSSNHIQGEEVIPQKEIRLLLPKECGINVQPKRNNCPLCNKPDSVHVECVFHKTCEWKCVADSWKCGLKYKNIDYFVLYTGIIFQE